MRIWPFTWKFHFIWTNLLFKGSIQLLRTNTSGSLRARQSSEEISERGGREGDEKRSRVSFHGRSKWLLCVDCSLELQVKGTWMRLVHGRPLNPHFSVSGRPVKDYCSSATNLFSKPLSFLVPNVYKFGHWPTAAGFWFWFCFLTPACSISEFPDREDKCVQTLSWEPV